MELTALYSHDCTALDSNATNTKQVRHCVLEYSIGGHNVHQSAVKRSVCLGNFDKLLEQSCILGLEIVASLAEGCVMDSCLGRYKMLLFTPNLAVDIGVRQLSVPVFSATVPVYPGKVFTTNGTQFRLVFHSPSSICPDLGNI